MTREQYVRMTDATRRALARLPGGTRLLRLPTLVCAAVYIAAAAWLAVSGDARVLRVIAVPAACFLLVTALRPIIGKTRPYDRFGAPPVGKHVPGKGKSMPSRHAASAAAIACAIVYAWPTVPVACCMLALCALIAALRVLSGQHDVSDVMAALALALCLSAVGYLI